VIGAGFEGTILALFQKMNKEKKVQPLHSAALAQADCVRLE
jgi:hypothetical protein